MHDSPQPVIQSTNRLVAEVRGFFGVVSDPVAMAVLHPEEKLVQDLQGSGVSAHPETGHRHFRRFKMYDLNELYRL